jgi:hypothetical protein
MLQLIRLRMDVQWSVLLARYGEPWRLRRKSVERSFRPASLATYHAVQGTRARVLATRLLQNPREWTAHVELSGFSLICSILRLNYHFPSFQSEQMLAMTYGYEARGHHDKTIEAAKKLSDIGTRASLPGSLLVNEFPFRE